MNLQLILMYELLKGFIFIFIFDIISRMIFDDFVMIENVLIFNGFYTQGITFFVSFTACSDQICSHWLIWKLLFGLWNDLILMWLGVRTFQPWPQYERMFWIRLWFYWVKETLEENMIEFILQYQLAFSILFSLGAVLSDFRTFL